MGNKTESGVRKLAHSIFRRPWVYGPLGSCFSMLFALGTTERGRRTTSRRPEPPSQWRSVAWSGGMLCGSMQCLSRGARRPLSSLPCGL